jgi:hypothetical protein
MENIKNALLDASRWEDFITIEESKMQIPYFELKEIVINRIIEKYKLK